MDETVKLWDVLSQELIYTSKYHLDSVNKCMFSPDGNTYFSMSKDKNIFEYDLRMKGVLTRFAMEEEPKDMQFVGELLVAGDTIGNIRWFTRNGELIYSHKGDSGVLAMAIDQTSNWMVVSRKDNHVFEMYETGNYCS
jgi:WD40 repeat protein